jgi:hypothetical protein
MFVVIAGRSSPDDGRADDASSSDVRSLHVNWRVSTDWPDRRGLVVDRLPDALESQCGASAASFGTIYRADGMALVRCER